MLYNLKKITADVRPVLDQNRQDPELIRLRDKDTLEVDDIIAAHVETAARAAILQAPAPLLDYGHNFGDAIYWGTNGCGWTLLPDDFLRLVVFEMSDWERPVFDPITPADPEYRLQSSPFPGLRGNPSRLVCAVVNRSEGLALEFFSCADNEAYITQAAYTPVPAFDRNGCIDIPERIYPAAVLLTASMTATTLADANLAAALMETFKMELK